MIVTLSPAKLLNFEPLANDVIQTIPLYTKQASELNDILRMMEMSDIQKLMKINTTQAIEVYQYIHGFNSVKTPEKPSSLAYNGITYKALNAVSMTHDDIDFAQKHLRIFSGLYGILRPLDLIKPYRLELQTKLYNTKGDDLYSFWKNTITENLINLLHKDDNIWVNLMSNEYTKVVDQKKMLNDIQIITPNFKEYTNKGLRQVVVHTKKARGLFAQFIIKNRIAEVENLKTFDSEGYYYSPELSTDSEWMFVR